ncbi:transposase [Gordonia sp. L191]|nr:transposase [Gordonia sp. L191]WHU49869.1 transposase [Gordonia sp. L191]
MLAFDTTPARRWEPKQLRLQLFSIAGRLTRHSRRTRLKLAATAPHLQLLLDGLARLAALPDPGRPGPSTERKTLPRGREPRRPPTLGHTLTASVRNPVLRPPTRTDSHGGRHPAKHRG